MPEARVEGADAQVAELVLSGGPAQLKLRVSLTPAGLWAIGGMVSAILLSTAVIVRMAGPGRR